MNQYLHKLIFISSSLATPNSRKKLSEAKNHWSHSVLNSSIIVLWVVANWVKLNIGLNKICKYQVWEEKGMLLLSGALCNCIAKWMSRIHRGISGLCTFAWSLEHILVYILWQCHTHTVKTFSYESYDHVIDFPTQVVCLDFQSEHWGEASDCSWRLETEAACCKSRPNQQILKSLDDEKWSGRW